MKTLPITFAALLLAGPALACMGTAEYPRTAEALAQSNLSPERKVELEKALREGWAMHGESHEQGDGAKMGESILILRQLQGRIPEK